MTRPRRQAAQVASLVCQERRVAAVRVDERKPRPVDNGRDDRGHEVPSPRWRPSTWFAIRPDGTPARSTARAQRRSAPEIQPLYLNNCERPTASPSNKARAGFGPLEESLAQADRGEPEQEKRRIGQGHPRKRDMRPRECGEGRGSPPCSWPERSPRQPGRHRNRQGAGARSTRESPRGR